MSAAASAQVVDDTRHSLLSKARPLSQTALEGFLDMHRQRASASQLARSDYATFDVRELDVKSALTECRLPGFMPWSLNPYVGCSHACTYCYVPDVAHLERKRWGSYVIVKRNLPFVLSRELTRKEPREVFLSSATDPYQPVEGKHQITRSCLEVLRRADWPLRVLTRSPLVLRDVELLRSFSDVAVGLSVPTLDDEARAVIEPAAPPIEARLEALRELAEAGLNVFANLAPVFPLTGGVTPAEVARTFQYAKVAKLYIGRWNYLEGVLPVLRERAAGTLCAGFEKAVADPRAFERLCGALEAACQREGVELRVMT